MDNPLLVAMALVGAFASVIFIIKHGTQFVKWIAATRAKVKAGIPAEFTTRIEELERIVKQHDGVLATVASKPVAQPAPAAAPAVS